MRSYLNLLSNILETGEEHNDRTGVGTTRIFGYQWRHDLRKGFPLLTTKKMSFKIVVAELLWMLSGSTNIKPLQDQGVHIWDEWADENGELGPVYGRQWRNFGEHITVLRGEGNELIPIKVTGQDQIANLISGLQVNPESRRHIVTAWNPMDIGEMKLPPCHFCFQCSASGDGRLSMHVNMRSADSFLGVPYNIAFYALLTHFLASMCDLGVGDLIFSFGDLHIYKNHFNQVMEQLNRNPRPLPTLERVPYIEDFEDAYPAMFKLTGYDPHPAIKAPVAV